MTEHEWPRGVTPTMGLLRKIAARLISIHWADEVAFRGLPGFVHVSEYGAARRLHNDEVGAVECFRVVCHLGVGCVSAGAVSSGVGWSVSGGCGGTGLVSNFMNASSPKRWSFRSNCVNCGAPVMDRTCAYCLTSH